MWPQGQWAPLRQLPRQPLALTWRQLEAAPASSAGSWRPGSRRRGGPVRGGPARHTAPPAPALAGGPHTRGPAPPTGPATEREGHAESGQTNCRAHDTCAAQPTLGASRETAVSGHLPSESGSWAVGVRGTAGAGVSRRGLRKVSEQFRVSAVSGLHLRGRTCGAQSRGILPVVVGHSGAHAAPALRRRRLRAGRGWCCCHTPLLARRRHRRRGHVGVAI